MMRIFTFAGMTLIIFFLLTIKAMAITLDLEYCIETALKRDIHVKAYFEAQEVVHQKWLAERHKFWPVLDLSVNSGWIDSEFSGEMRDLTTSAPFASQKETAFGNIGIDLSFPIFTEGSFLGYGAPGTAAALKGIEEKDYELLLAKRDLIEEIIDEYLGLLSAERDRKLHQEECEFTLWLYKETQERYHRGLVDEVTLKQVELQKKKAEIELESVKYDCRVARQKLAFRLGVDSDGLEISPYPVEEICDQPLPDCKSLQGLIREKHPEIRLLTATKDKLYWEYNRDRKRNWPILNFSSGTYYHKEPDVDYRKLYYFAIGLKGTFDRVRIDQYRQSFHSYRQAEKEHDARLRDLELEAMENYHALRKKQLDIRGKKFDLALNRVLLSKAKKKFLLGLIELTELMEAQIEITEVEKEIFQDQCSLVQEIVKYKHSIGSTWNEL